MIRTFTVATAALCIASSANALTVKQYRDEKKQDVHALHKLYLGGVLRGFLWFNATLENDHKAQYFCLPKKLSLTVEQAEDIMLRQAKEETTTSVVDSFPVELLLFYGLRDTFPCEAK